MTGSKAVIAIAGAVVLLGLLVSSASARMISSTSETYRAKFREVTFAGGFGSIVCGLTLEGSFHSRTLVKTVGALVGYISRAILQKPCRAGDATILTASLPWHVQYAGFVGTLPAITDIKTDVVGAAFNTLEPVFGMECLARTTAASPGIAQFSLIGGVAAEITLSGRIPTTCTLNGELAGRSAALTVLNGTSRISITLI